MNIIAKIERVRWFVIVLLCSLAIGANAELPSASDFMNGAPPAAGTLVTKANWFIGPYNRWGLQHVREITPTREISRGDGPTLKLQNKAAPITAISVADIAGDSATVKDWLNASYTDGLLVLHKGKILAEVYMNDMTDHSYHNFFSMSKSFAGNLAGILIDQGQLNPDARIASYVPEMVGGAYGDATVRQLLDMTIGIDHSEDYDDPTADVYVYSASSNANPNPQALKLYDVLPKFKKAGNHGEKFHYVTANTDALGWVLQRASGRALGELLETEIWSKLGAENNAYVISDLNGTPWMGGGLNTTLRDAGRFGLMMLNGGQVKRDQVVPAAFVKDIQANAIPTGFPGLSYRNQWWVNPDNNSYSAMGVSGQRLLIAPALDLVVVKLSSWPALSGYHAEGRAYDARAFDAIMSFVVDL